MWTPFHWCRWLESLQDTSTGTFRWKDTWWWAWKDGYLWSKIKKEANHNASTKRQRHNWSVYRSQIGIMRSKWRVQPQLCAWSWQHRGPPHDWELPNWALRRLRRKTERRDPAHQQTKSAVDLHSGWDGVRKSFTNSGWHDQASRCSQVRARHLC